MDVSENSGTPKSSILLGFSIINHPFWGTPIFGNTHMTAQLKTRGQSWLSCLKENWEKTMVFVHDLKNHFAQYPFTKCPTYSSKSVCVCVFFHVQCYLLLSNF